MNSPSALSSTGTANVSNEALLRVYAVLLAALTVALALTLNASGQLTIGDVKTVILLAVIALLVERQSVSIADHLEMSISVLPILFAALALGSGAAMLVGASALLLDFRPPFTRWVIWTSGRASVAGLAGLLAALIVGDARSSLGILLVAALVIAAFEACADTGLTAITLRLRGNSTFSEASRTLAQVLTAALPLYAPLLAVVAYTYQVAGLWAGMLVLVPSLAAQRLFVMWREQRRLTVEVTDALSRLERISVSFAAAMVAALDARDHYTAGHSATVAVYARDTAKEMGLSLLEQEQAHLCGLLHDVGKIGIPTELLEKRGPLTDDERLAIEMHVDIGAAILNRVEGYADIAAVVQHHHEHYDGSGYPEQMRGPGIPVLSRIVAVADAYSAMTSERPYRTAMSSENARSRLLEASGSQFDPSVIEAFVAVLDQSNEAYALGTHTDFAVEVRELANLESQPQLVAV